MAESQRARAALEIGGNLWLLGGSVVADERLSWRGPEDAGRCDPLNVYLAMDGDKYMLIETGVALFAHDVLAQIESVAGHDVRLSRIALTRNEPDTVSAIPALASHLAIRDVYSPGLMNPLQFFDHVTAREQFLSFGAIQIPAMPGADIGIGSVRSLKVVQTPLRMLSTTWYFDTPTGTLFCSDIFTDGLHDHGQEPVIREPVGTAALLAGC